MQKITPAEWDSAVRVPLCTSGKEETSAQRTFLGNGKDGMEWTTKKEDEDAQEEDAG